MYSLTHLSSHVVVVVRSKELKTSIIVPLMLILSTILSHSHPHLIWFHARFPV